MTEETPECSIVLEWMFAFLDHELSESQGDTIRLHLFACEDCLDEYDHVLMIRTVVKRSCSVAAPSELRTRLLAELRRKPPLR